MESPYERAVLLLERKQPDQVLQIIGPELSRNFNDYAAMELCGHARYQRGEFGEAAILYKSAHMLNPSVDVLMNLGVCFKQVDDMKSAEDCWRLALEMDPPAHLASQLLANVAGCFTANGTPEQALETYRKALEMDPTNRVAAYNMCWPYLETRDWARGFRAYDMGFNCGTRLNRTYDGVPGIDLDLTPEQMRDAVRGKKVIVWGDQGLGDEIMAAGCIPDLMRDGCEVTFDCHPRLKGIFERSFGIECTGTRKTGKIEWFRGRKFDIAVVITTLMTMYRSDGWPGGPYLKPALDGAGRPSRLRIGISWAGGVMSTRANLRSMPLTALAPLFGHDADWVSLQYHESASPEVCRLEETHGIHIKHFPQTLQEYDYDKTMSLVASLDLVITVCTTVMHLAGAMGIPCWTLTPSRPPWVMGMHGEELPMYKSVRQFRQLESETDWSGVVSRVGAALDERFGPRPWFNQINAPVQDYSGVQQMAAPWAFSQFGDKVISINGADKPNEAAE